MTGEDLKAVKTVRRLIAAEGYLELDMPDYALEEIDAVGDPGPFEAVVELIRGEAYKGQRRYRDAIGPLKRAAELIPAPHNRQAWLSLSECFRKDGDVETAKLIEKFANSPAAK